MKYFSISPKGIVDSLWSNRNLLVALTKSEVIGRYRGSFLGILWSFFNPVFMLAVYTFVFSEVLKARWSLSSESKTEFALVLFSGLIVFNLFAECINRAPGLILSNINYVKKVVFPLEILPVVTLLASLFHAVISFCVWLLAYFILFGHLQITVFFLPLVLLPLFLLILGLTWTLASLGVYLRDVGQFIGLITTVLMFLSPVFYPATAFPDAYRYLLELNPLTLVIEQVRAVLYFGILPDVVMLSMCYIVSLIMAWMGFAWFQKTRKGFADVL